MVNKDDDSKVISGTGSGIAGHGSADSTQHSAPSAAIPPRRPRPVAVKGRKGFQQQPILPHHREAARKLAAGAAIKPTLMAAGYSENTANRGIDALRGATPVLRALREGLQDMALTPSHSDAEDGNIVTNVLRENIMLRRDRALGSLTTLARIRGLMQPELQVGIVINSLPDDAPAVQWTAPAEPDATE